MKQKISLALPKCPNPLYNHIKSRYLDNIKGAKEHQANTTMSNPYDLSRNPQAIRKCSTQKHKQTKEAQEKEEPNFTLTRQVNPKKVQKRSFAENQTTARSQLTLL